MATTRIGQCRRELWVVTLRGTMSHGLDPTLESLELVSPLLSRLQLQDLLLDLLQPELLQLWTSLLWSSWSSSSSSPRSAQQCSQPSAPAELSPLQPGRSRPAPAVSRDCSLETTVWGSTLQSSTLNTNSTLTNHKMRQRQSQTSGPGHCLNPIQIFCKMFFLLFRVLLLYLHWHSLLWSPCNTAIKYLHQQSLFF